MHDGSSDVTRAVEDMLRRDVFRGPLQENCETAAATRCQRGSVCQVDHASYTASRKLLHMTIAGLTVAQRLRRWPSSKPIMGEWLVFTGNPIITRHSAMLV